jgi:hypothetical protein
MSRGSPSPARAYDERRGRGAPPRGTEPNLHQWGHDPRGAQCACGPASEHRARVAQWNRASASGLGALASQPRFLGALDWYSDIYGIRAPNTCRARQYKCSILDRTAPFGDPPRPVPRGGPHTPTGSARPDEALLPSSILRPLSRSDPVILAYARPNAVARHCWSRDCNPVRQRRSVRANRQLPRPATGPICSGLARLA